MGATVDTQALDLRAQGGLDGGKSRGGQGGDADAFAGLLSDLDDAKPSVSTDAAAASSVAATPSAPPLEPGRLTLSPGTFAVTTATSMPAAVASLPLPADKSLALRQQVSLPDATVVPAPPPAAADPSASIGQVLSADAASSTTSLFQALIDGTGTKTSVKAKAAQRDDETMPAPAATPNADAQGALALPALIAAAAASPAPAVPPPTTQTQAISPASTQAASGVMPAPSNKASPAVASPVIATADDSTLPTDTAVPISDVKIETHIAVAANHAVAKDAAEPQASKAEATEAAAPAGALSAMAPQTRSVVQAVETLLDQAPVAAAADLATAVAPAPPRTMTLQLTPPDLGTVQVRLHLNGQALDLQLSVSSKETLGAINRDRGHLETALASQNYDLRTLTIQGAGGTGAETTGDPQAGGRGTSDQGAAQNQGPSTSGNSAGGSNGERRPTNNRDIASDEDARAAAAPRAGALFV